jgi:hypothetical protein
MDQDPDPAIFVFDLQSAKFFCVLLFEGTFTVGIKVFLTIFA